MLFNVGPYEALIVAGVFVLVTAGPIVAGLVVAWVRRRRAGRGADRSGPAP